MSPPHREQILALARQGEVFANRDVVAVLGISRQAVHRHLRALVEAGELEAEGAGRGRRYRLPGPRKLVFETAGLEEDRVWRALRAEVPVVSSLSEASAAVLSYAVTELVNNAIDHSGSPTVELVVDELAGRARVDVIDHGEGLFDHVRRSLSLDSDLEALGELSKGKTTTMPERHSGEGLFFVSKAAAIFEAESGRLAWIVDNVEGDVAIAEVAPVRVGTRVRFETDPEAPTDLDALFAEYTRDLRFSRTRTWVKLFESATRFISRSEARRLMQGLDKFEEVVLDFRGVTAVGQGFADEVFRVWAADNPAVLLEPVNMSEPVAFMVGRSVEGGRRVEGAR